MVVLLSVIVPIAGVIIGLVAARDTFDDINFAEPVDETTYLPGQEPGENGVNVLTTQGYDDLVHALEDETGSTWCSAPRSTRATRPVGAGAGDRQALPQLLLGRHDPGRQRHQEHQRPPRIDLESVEPNVMITLVEEVRGRVEDPTSWYANIDVDRDRGPRMAAYASNAYSEGAYLVATLHGEIIYESEYGT